MAICRTCESYYKLSKFNPTDKCESCAYKAESFYFDDEDSLEVDHLLNPSGKVQPKLYD